MVTRVEPCAPGLRLNKPARQAPLLSRNHQQRPLKVIEATVHPATAKPRPSAPRPPRQEVMLPPALPAPQPHHATADVPLPSGSSRQPKAWRPRRGGRPPSAFSCLPEPPPGSFAFAGPSPTGRCRDIITRTRCCPTRRGAGDGCRAELGDYPAIGRCHW